MNNIRAVIPAHQQQQDRQKIQGAIFQNHSWRICQYGRWYWYRSYRTRFWYGRL